MQKAMYPSKTIRITQRNGEGTHISNYATDEAGIDGGIGEIIAPFTGIIKKTYQKDAHEVWLESIEPVEYADGTIDYMTIMFAHCNDISHLYVGQQIEQGQVFYYEGTFGKAYGNHCHFECGKGKFIGTGWYQDENGWNINNNKLVTECLWVDDTYNIIDTRGLEFKHVVNYIGHPVTRDEYKDQLEVVADSLRARNSANGDILGYINKGVYNYTGTEFVNGYMWYEVQNNMWIAYNEEWIKLLNKKEEPYKKELEEVKEELEETKKELLNAKNETDRLKKQLDNGFKLIFTCHKTDLYGLNLQEFDELYIKRQNK